MTVAALNKLYSEEAQKCRCDDEYLRENVWANFTGEIATNIVVGAEILAGFNFCERLWFRKNLPLHRGATLASHKDSSFKL